MNVPTLAVVMRCCHTSPVPQEGPGPTGSVDVGAVPVREPGVWWPVATWTSIAGVLFTVQLTARWDRLRVSGSPAALLLVEGWRQFDAHQYVGIAIHGYWFDPAVPSNVVWFPLYPLAMRVTAPLFGSVQLAAFALSALSGLVVAVLFWRWLGGQVHDGGRRIAWAVLFLSPYGLFLYGAMYANAMTLAFVLGAFVCIEDRRPWVAGALGAFATASRPTALCLVPALLFLELERSGVLSAAPGMGGWRGCMPSRFDPAKLGLRTAAPLLSLTGVLAYSGYLGVKFGSPLAWIINERRFHPDPLSWRHAELVHQLADWAARGWVDPRYPLSALFHAVLVVAVLASSPFVGRRFGWGYGVFTALLAAVPLWSVGDFFGAGRYLLAAFPAFALFGEWLSSRRRLAAVVLSLSALTMVLLTAGFGRGWYLT